MAFLKRGRRRGDQSFEDVLAAARAGDEWAWAQLLEDLTPPALAYVRAQGVRDPDDVVGDMLMELVRGIETFEGSAARFRSWAFVIAHSRAVDALRRAGRRREDPVGEVPEPAGSMPDVGDTALGNLGAGDLGPLLYRLTDDQRDVLLLRVVAGLDAAETGEVLGKAADAVRSLQHRALTTLREQISQERVTP
jgi:RNA polymerase sigma-70 factor (ECF subfamily)